MFFEVGYYLFGSSVIIKWALHIHRFVVFSAFYFYQFNFVGIFFEDIACNSKNFMWFKTILFGKLESGKNYVVGKFIGDFFYLHSFLHMV